MIRTPSIGIDQNDSDKFVDKYYGRMPKLLHGIEEADISTCNPEYIELINGFMDLTIPSQNISDELLIEVEALVNEIGNDPGTRSWTDNQLIACGGW